MKNKALIGILLLSLAAAAVSGCGSDDADSKTESSGTEAVSAQTVSGTSAEASSGQETGGTENDPSRSDSQDPGTETFSVNTKETVLIFDGQTLTVSWNALEKLGCPVAVREQTAFGDGEIVSFSSESDRIWLSGSVFLGMEEDLFDFEDPKDEENAGILDVMSENLALQDEFSGLAEKTVSGLSYTFGEGSSAPDGENAGLYAFAARAVSGDLVVYLRVDAETDSRGDLESVSDAVVQWFEALKSGQEG